MKNKKLLAVLAVTISASVFMAGCGFGEDEPEAQKVVSVTPAPEVTKAPTATPTIAPNVQDTTYTSADKSVSINLPDATWANKTDETPSALSPRTMAISLFFMVREKRQWLLL